MHKYRSPHVDSTELNQRVPTILYKMDTYAKFSMREQSALTVRVFHATWGSKWNQPMHKKCVWYLQMHVSAKQMCGSPQNVVEVETWPYTLALNTFVLFYFLCYIQVPAIFATFPAKSSCQLENHTQFSGLILSEFRYLFI